MTHIFYLDSSSLIFAVFRDFIQTLIFFNPKFQKVREILNTKRMKIFAIGFVRQGKLQSISDVAFSIFHHHSYSVFLLLSFFFSLSLSFCLSNMLWVYANIKPWIFNNLPSTHRIFLRSTVQVISSGTKFYENLFPSFARYISHSVRSWLYCF